MFSDLRNFVMSGELTEERFLELFGKDHPFQILGDKPEWMLGWWQKNWCYDPEKALQKRLEAEGINCDAALVWKINEDGKEYLSARLNGPIDQELKAAPLAQELVNRLKKIKYKKEVA